jgi:hypothetical protein
MRRPKVTVRTPGSHLSGKTDSTIVEFAGDGGVGGLISIQQHKDGRVAVVLYRLDPQVEVTICPYSRTRG